jgi:hypothetical protein
VSIFAILALVTLDRARLVATLRSPAALIPILLFALMLIGVAGQRSHCSRRLRRPATAFTPRQALQIGYGFLAA